MSSVSNEADEDVVEKIELGGETFLCPVLAFRQNRRLHAPLCRLVTGPFSNKDLKATDLSDADIDDMATVLRVALTRAHPEMTEDKFDALEFGVAELVRAVPTVIQQSGMFRTRSGVAGEAPGTTSP